MNLWAVQIVCQAWRRVWWTGPFYQLVYPTRVYNAWCPHVRDTTIVFQIFTKVKYNDLWLNFSKWQTQYLIGCFNWIAPTGLFSQLCNTNSLKLNSAMKDSIVQPGWSWLFTFSDFDKMHFTIGTFDTIHQATVLLSEDLKMEQVFIKLPTFDFSVIYVDTFSVD